MIRGWIPGFTLTKSEYRYGDTQVLTDGTHTLVIDGMIGTGAIRLIDWLKKNNHRKVWLIITHWHDDHFAGIEKILGDSYFKPQKLWCPNPDWLKPGAGGYYSGDVEECMEDGKRIVALAKRKKIPVVHPVSGSSYAIGDIRFKLYKQQPKKVESDDTHAWSFVNGGSISAWFPDLGYWTSGDGSGAGDQKARIQHLGLTGKIRFFKIDHHGNYCSESNARFFRAQGARYCWYNDIEPGGIGTTEFTAYGARRCKQAGIHVFESVGDINWIARDGKVVIYKDMNSYSYACAYKGRNTLKGSSRAVALDVIAGKYGENNSRITNLLDAGYYPLAVQMMVNRILKEKKWH
jgi:hypothetical protein